MSLLLDLAATPPVAFLPFWYNSRIVSSEYPPEI